MYVSVECPECGRQIRHSRKDVAIKQSRICPGCGRKLELSGFIRDET